MRAGSLLAMLLVLTCLQGDVFLEQEADETIITVDSTNLRFSPSSVTVTEGDTVRFFWSGQALPHNAVERDGLFDSGDPERNVDYSFTFEVGTNGTYEFVCEPHESVGMIGQITVEPAPPSNSTNQTNETGLDSSGENTPFPSVVAALSAVVLAAVIRRSQGNG
ncbi:MAG: plastocyanin/azurin family copper-binding protein, partial [Candidatus Poseidonia sp.]|nr:plastocyanin/azurin family copper-binding protein [Poseidonia sp.]